MILGALAGGAASALVGGLLGGGDGGGARQTQQNISLPFTSDTGLFNASFDANQNLTTGISDPRLQAIQETGLLGAQDFLGRASTNATADQAGLLGQQFIDSLRVDPMQLAEEHFNLLNPILQRQQDRARFDQEARLFNQGRLGGTGGALEQQALFDAQSDARRKLLFDSFNQALNTRAQQANLGVQLAQLDPALRGSFQNLGTGFLNIPLSLQDAMLQQASVAGGLAGGRSTTSIDNSLDPASAIGAGLINAGVGQITGGIDSLFAGNNPGGGLFLDPTGFGPGGIFSGGGGL